MKLFKLLFHFILFFQYSSHLHHSFHLGTIAIAYLLHVLCHNPLMYALHGSLNGILNPQLELVTF